MTKSFIAAHDLFNFKKCAYRPFMDMNGDPLLKVEVHPIMQLLWKSGVQYEDKVIESYRRDRPEQSFAVPENLEETLAAMQGGIDIIAHGVLLSGKRMGRPQLLLKTSGTSTFGDYHYAPMDIKSTRVESTWDNGDEKTSMEQFWQIYFYGELLEQIQGRRPEKGFIYKTKQRVLSVPFYKPPKDYALALDQLESYLQGNAFGAEPAINSNCGLCAWKKVCSTWAKEKRDVSLVHHVGQAMKRGLSRLGINTVETLAAEDPTALVDKVEKLKAQGFFWNQMPADLPRKIVDRARIFLGGKPVIHQAFSFPEAKKEIHFDLEDDPTRDFVYLYGALLVEPGEEPEYHTFFAETREEERGITLQLLAFLNQHADAAVYHYSDYEKITLKRLLMKHNIETPAYDRLFGKPGTAVDLFAFVTQYTDWPLTSYGIKEICKFLGFQWDAADAGGAASVVWMNDYLAGDAQLKQKILRYNEDDCRATYFLKNELMKMMKA